MKKYIVFLAAMLTGFCGMACSTFFLNRNGQLVFGRNYDWITGAGIVHSNQRGLFKTSAVAGSKLTWVSAYGSFTFNQYGKEFPTGGMNEKGLVVELMWLNETTYPPADDRAPINVLQWIQYQLDNNTSVDEVIASDKSIRISPDETPLHYLVADAAGNTASIEFLHGKMVVHKGSRLPYPVLTNNTYQKSLEATRNALKTSKLPGDNSLDRFVTACKMVNALNTTAENLSLTEYAFSILDKVAQGDYTKWSIVYDVSNKKILFKTAGFKHIKSFRFAAFDFSCSTSAKMFNMNQPANGDITGQFIAGDKKIKQAIVAEAVRESSGYVTISEAEKKTLMEFEEGIKCK